MNTDKQIEEMTKDLCDIDCKGMKCNVCDSYGCEYRMQAEALYNAGYRKASEVAREIFEEIEEYISRMFAFSEKEQNSYDDLSISKFIKDFCKGELSALWDMSNFIAELKKKYTGEDTK